MNALLWVGIALIILWLIGWVAFQAAGFLIHLLLIAGVVLLVWWAVKQVL